MNFVNFHIGDWIAATSILSATERGVYFDLLCRYYREERPLMQEECKRIARAFDVHEQEAMQYVLEKFFELGDDGAYHHSRCDEEIAKVKALIEKRRSAAHSRWDKAEKPANAEQTQCTSNANAYASAYANGMQSNNHNPISNISNKKESKKKKVEIEKPEGVDDQVWADLLSIRKAKRAPLTQTAWKGIEREAEKAGISIPEALRMMVERGWAGFKAEWWQREAAQRAPVNRDAADWRTIDTANNIPPEMGGLVVW